MLKSLSISNIALIDRADIEFSGGVNVLSGETGAGKSVILESIDFALGAKADKSMIRSGETECAVRAEFSTTDPAVFEILREFEIEADDTLIITRRFSADGKGGARINGCPVTAAMLRRVTSRLVDVHGQSEHLSLLKESSRLRLLDKTAGEAAAAPKKEIAALLAERKEIMSALERLGGDGAERMRRMDVLRFQIDEIKRAAVREGEEEELVSLREKYLNAEKILTGLNGACEAILSDGGAADAVRTAQRALLQIAKYGDYGTLAERLDAVCSELSDVGACAESYASELDLNEGELERIENRLDEIRAVKKKYGADFREIGEFLRRAEEEYELLQDSGARVEELTARRGICEKNLYESCVKLQKARQKAAKELTARVVEELKTLNIPAARFEVEFDEFSPEDAPKATAEGLGGVRFLFSANAGEPLKELGKIISGGELSRFMLAVKAQLNASEEIGAYLFDEIDSGIGGRTARSVAEKFCKIAKRTQIIAVSHLAQIAACADRQFLIEKIREGEKTFTRVKALGGEERRRELARLLSGDAGEVSLRHADELLQQAQAYKNSL